MFSLLFFGSSTLRHLPQRYSCKTGVNSAEKTLPSHRKKLWDLFHVWRTAPFLPVVSRDWQVSPVPPRLAARTISRCDTVKHTAQSLADTTCVGRFLFALLWHAASCKYKSCVLEREGRITEWIMPPELFFLRSANRVTLPEIYATPDLPRCVLELIFSIDNARHIVSHRVALVVKREFRR